jgi:hypothetical protein
VGRETPGDESEDCSMSSLFRLVEPQGELVTDGDTIE